MALRPPTTSSYHGQVRHFLPNYWQSQKNPADDYAEDIIKLVNVLQEILRISPNAPAPDSLVGTVSLFSRGDWQMLAMRMRMYGFESGTKFLIEVCFLETDCRLFIQRSAYKITLNTVASYTVTLSAFRTPPLRQWQDGPSYASSI